LHIHFVEEAEMRDCADSDCDRFCALDWHLVQLFDVDGEYPYPPLDSAWLESASAVSAARGNQDLPLQKVGAITEAANPIMFGG